MTPKKPCYGLGKGGRERLTHKWESWFKDRDGAWYKKCLNDLCYAERTRKKTPRGYREPIILVIAGNHREFEYWRREKRLFNWDVRYVYSEEQLLGIRGATVEKWGHWLDNPIWKVPGIEFRLEEVQRK